MNPLPQFQESSSKLRWIPLKGWQSRTRPQWWEIPEGRPDQGILRRDALYRRHLAAADVISAMLAVVLGIAVLGDYDTLRPAVLACTPLVLFVSKTVGLYDRDEHLISKKTLEEAPALFQVATLYALLIWLGEAAFVSGGELGKDQVLGLWGLLFVFMLAGRCAARWIAGTRAAPERCIVIGDADSAARLQRKAVTTPSAHLHVVGRVPLDSEGRTSRNGSGNGAHAGNGKDNGHSPLPVLGDVDSLGLVLLDKEIDRVVIAPGTAFTDEMLDVIRLVRSLGIRVSVLPRLFEVVGSSVEFDDVEGVTLLGLRREGLTPSSRALKRSLDLVASTIGLVLLLPGLLAIAIAVKVSSPGPVLFRQKRIGREGREFEMLKFRTMEQDAEARRSDLQALNEANDGLFKIVDDPRLTRVGRFLRRASLDELPQLINVLRGQMSLVGPRPLVPDEDRRVEGWDRSRLHMTPGITGAWQIFGPMRIPLNEMVKMDYLYGANWSLWLDVRILLRTIPYALGRRGL